MRKERRRLRAPTYAACGRGQPCIPHISSGHKWEGTGKSMTAAQLRSSDGAHRGCALPCSPRLPRVSVGCTPAAHAAQNISQAQRGCLRPLPASTRTLRFHAGWCGPAGCSWWSCHTLRSSLAGRTTRPASLWTPGTPQPATRACLWSGGGRGMSLMRRHRCAAWGLTSRAAWAAGC